MKLWILVPTVSRVWTRTMVLDDVRIKRIRAVGEIRPWELAHPIWDVRSTAATILRATCHHFRVIPPRTEWNQIKAREKHFMRSRRIGRRGRWLGDLIRTTLEILRTVTRKPMWQVTIRTITRIWMWWWCERFVLFHFSIQTSHCGTWDLSFDVSYLITFLQ